MPYDINVLVLEQEKPIKLEFATPVKLRNEIDHKGYGRYFMWPYVTQQKGIWYNIVAKRSNVRDAYRICGPNFDVKETKLPIPHWVEDENVKCELTPLIIYEKYIKDLERIIKILIAGSPCKTIMFLARYQGLETEIITGVLDIDKFFGMLVKQEILFNICYIIRDKSVHENLMSEYMRR